MTPLMALLDLADRVAAKGKYDVFFGYNSRDKQFALSWARHPYEYSENDSSTISFRHVKLTDAGTIQAIRSKLEQLLEEK